MPVYKIGPPMHISSQAGKQYTRLDSKQCSHLPRKIKSGDRGVHVALQKCVEQHLHERGAQLGGKCPRYMKAPLRHCEAGHMHGPVHALLNLHGACCGYRGKKD